MKHAPSAPTRLAELALGVISGAAMMSMMVITVLDVVGRYLFQRPLTGALEVTEILLVLTVFSGLALAALKRTHIEIDVLERWFPAALWRALGLGANALFGLCLGYAGYLMTLQAHRLGLDGETTMMLKVPLVFVGWAMAVLLFVCAALHLATTVSDLLGRSAPEQQPGDAS